MVTEFKKISLTILIVIFLSTFLMCQGDNDQEDVSSPSENEEQVSTEEEQTQTSETESTNSSQGSNHVVEEVKVAFLGDQGMDEDSEAVLTLVASENTDFVLHQGDLDYDDDPIAWDNMVTGFLGENFPYFASIGNHDVAEWPAYQSKLQERLNKVSGATCTGDLGVSSVCSYKGIEFVLSGIGTIGVDSEMEINLLANLNSLTSKWRICSWHKNQTLMQVGYKNNSVGWMSYELCRHSGAIIATGHEHSYSRTHLMSEFSDTPVVASTSNTLVLEEGKTFAFVSGLSGSTIRGQNPTLIGHPWWASIYTSDQGANFGALFCTFHYQGQEDQAHCYFKNIDGTIVDEFNLVSNL